MIVVDTSAIMAIVLNEPRAQDCERAVVMADSGAISAATLAEIMIVAGERGVADVARHVLDVMALDVMSVDGAMAARVSDAYRMWGKGNHPARLNMGDCFAYALARHLNCPLLYVGNDFSQTDIRSAL